MPALSGLPVGVASSMMQEETMASRLAAMLVKETAIARVAEAAGGPHRKPPHPEGLESRARGQARWPLPRGLIAAKTWTRLNRAI